MPTIEPNPLAAGQAARLRKVGALLFWSGLFGSSLGIGLRQVLPFWGPLAVTLTLAALAVTGATMMRRGRKLMAVRGEAALANDERAPVVYLRSFAADDEGAGTFSSKVLLRPTYHTEEEQLAMVFQEIGPFVAIGDPREDLPDLGAARIYVGDGRDWRAVIADLMTRAQLVILRAGSSEGVLWELRLAGKTVAPERLLLLVPADEREYASFRAQAASVLPHPLPELLAQRRVLGRTRAIVAFASDWRGWVLPTLGSFWRTPMRSPYVARVKLTLRPVFERLGVPWTTPPLARGKLALLVTCAVLLAPLGLLWAALELPQYFYVPPASPPEYEYGPAQPPPSPYDQAIARMGERLTALPEFRAAVASARDGAAARVLGADLGSRGLRRLSDDDLLQQVALMRSIADAADTSTCAALLTGASAGSKEAALRQLSAPEIERWFEVAFNAMAAELRKTPLPPEPPQAHVDHALALVLGRLTRAEGALLTAVLAAPQDKPITDICRATRWLYGALNEIDTAPRLALARALMTPVD